VAKPIPRAALSLLREWVGDRPVPKWQHWIIAVEPTGRITLPSGARQVLGSGSCAQAVTRDGVLVLHRRDGGASLAIDRRGRLVLPAWLRTPARSSGSVVVAARASGVPAVVVAPTDVLEGIVSHVAEAM
jgi:DNA-binding transcriptional regulator/RsmH inhibitor MraZ